MPPMDASPHTEGDGSSRERSERIFADFLAAREGGGEVDFEALLARHPAERAVLRQLMEEWLELESALDAMDLSEAFRSWKEGSGSPTEADPPSFLGRLARRSDLTDRYRVEEEVGVGGMGVILRAWDADLKRWVAMKRCRARVSGGSEAGESTVKRLLARFVEEAQIASQLDHPGIVPIHELGVDAEGNVYFTMKLVDGKTLSQVLGEDGRVARWSRSGTLGVLVRVCEAMAYAHDKGVIHRDLKPSNLMIGHFGEVFVMDWGLARIRNAPEGKDLRIRGRDEGPVQGTRRDDGSDGSTELLTMDGDVLGTPAYMSPEQARGEIERLADTADIYSVGAILYHVLAGAPPFADLAGEDAWHETLRRLREGPPTPLAQIAPDTPPEVVAICEKAMSRRPEERYGSMLDLAADLRAFLELGVVKAYRAGALVELGKWVQRNRAIATGAAVGAVAIVVALIGLLTIRGRLLQRQEEVLAHVSSNDLTREGLRAAEAFDDPAALLLFANSVAAAGQRTQVESGLARLVFWDRRTPRVEGVHALLGPPRWIDFQPGGGHLAVQDVDGRTVVFEVGSMEQVLVVPEGESLTSFAWSPGGRELLLGSSEGEVRRYDAETWTESRERVRWGAGPVRRLVFGPLGERLLVVADQVAVVLWSREEIEGTLADPSRVLDARLDPDERLAVTVCEGDLAVVHDLTERPMKAVMELGHRVGIRYPVPPAFVGAPTRWIARDFDGIRLTPLGDGDGEEHLFSPPSYVHALVASPNGRYLAVIGFGGVSVWDQETQRDTHHATGSIVDCAWTIDSSSLLLVSDNSEAWLWPIDAAEQPRFLPHGGPVLRCAASQDGMTLATVEEAGLVRVWARQAPALRLASRAARTWSEAGFAPDGTVAAAVRLPHAPAFAASDGFVFHQLDGATLLPRGPALQVSGFPRAVAYAPAGPAIATLCGPSRDRDLLLGARRSEPGEAHGLVQVWDRRTGRSLTEAVRVEGAPLGLRYSPDGSRLVVFTDRRVTVLSGEDHRELGSSDHDRPAQAYWLPREWVEFSPDGRFFVPTPLVGEQEVWSVERAEPVAALGLHALCTRARIVPHGDGSLLFLATRDGRVVRRALHRDGAVEERAELSDLQHPVEVRDLDVSPGGEWLATGCLDGYARVFGAGDASPPLAALRHQAPVGRVLFHPLREHWLITCTMGNNRQGPEVQVWDWHQGLPITEPVSISTGLNRIGPDDVHVIRDGSTLVLESREAGLDRIDLSSLLDGSRLEDGFASDSLIRYAEIRTGHRLLVSRGLWSARPEKVSNDAWLSRLGGSLDLPAELRESSRTPARRAEWMEWSSEHAARRGDNDAVERWLAALTELEGDPAPLEWLGRVRDEAGDGARAAAALTRCLEADPTRAGAAHQLAILHAREGRWPAALHAAGQALEAGRPTLSMERVRLLELLASGDVEAYRAGCDRLVAEYGASRHPFLLGWLAWHCGLPAQAPSAAPGLLLSCESALLAAHSPLASDRIGLGALLLRTGHAERARDVLSDCLGREDLWRSGSDPRERWTSELDGFDPGHARLLLALALARTGDRERAARLLDEVGTVRASVRDDLRRRDRWDRALELDLLFAELDSLLR